MGSMKIFSGSQILAAALKQRIEAIGIEVEVKDNIQSARMSGFPNNDVAVELFIQEIDFGKAHPIIEQFRMEI